MRLKQTDKEKLATKAARPRRPAPGHRSVI
jgi:hypothetical protein